MSTAKSETTSDSDSKNNKIIFQSICLILGGCILNNFVLELLVREDPGIGNLLTFLQFAFTAFQGFFLHFSWSPFGMKSRSTPIVIYLMMNVIFVSLSVINNKAFEYAISQPVHMVFRSSSLLSSLLIGLLFFNKRYSKGEVLGAFLVTVGIITVTSAEGLQKSKKSGPLECVDCGGSSLKSNLIDRNNYPLSADDLSTWSIGVAMLLIALLLSSLLGHIQEWTYKTYGKNWKEGLFYTHLLGLPYFFLLKDDIMHHVQVCNRSQTIHLWEGISPIPSLWIYLIFNVITQLICIYGVFMLTGAAGTLTCTLTLTVRKFISLVISIIYFNNPFTLFHWGGSMLVFLGSAYYVWGKDPAKTKKD